MQNNNTVSEKDIEELNRRLSQALGRLSFLMNKQKNKQKQYKKDYNSILEDLKENILTIESVLKVEKS